MGGFEERIDAVRRFNRFHTRKIGVLDEKLLKSPFSLTEARVIYELAQRLRPTASELADDLDLDPGNMSRILGRFEERGLVERTPSEIDRRELLLSLTVRGEEAFAALDEASRDEVGSMLGGLSGPDQRRLVRAMETVRGLLGDEERSGDPVLIRAPRPGDMGWVVQRHGELYAREYGWNEEFEALVADIVAKFMQERDRNRDRCWIAERDGENAGCVFLVHHPERPTVARLRLLLVEPAARGAGIGTRLVEECVRTARRLGYERITLWTNDVLHAARRIYERAGFELVDQEPHHSFGHDLVGQTWELELRSEAGRSRDAGTSPGFQDHFSDRAVDYAAHRPTYPDELVEFLADAAPGRDRAWDCGCGSGQLSSALASRFRHVVATDASSEQLARASRHARISYCRARVEASGLGGLRADLVTAAQAAHWFDLPGFYEEVGRVARPGALVALVSYAMMRIDDAIDPVIDRFNSEVLEDHWPPARRLVDEGYRSLAFPFAEIEVPRFEIRERWRLADVRGYVESWSAVGHLERSEGRDALEAFHDELGAVWGSSDLRRSIRWPLSIRAGYVGG